MATDAFGFDFDEAAGTMDPETQRKMDARLLVQFFMHPVLDEIRTKGGIIHKRHPLVKELQAQGVELEPNEEETGPDWRKHVVVPPAGRNVFKDVEYVSIQRWGDRDSILIRPVSDADRKRFAERYAEWKKGEQDLVHGTPLAELSFVPPSVREELAGLKVRTAEQMVEVAPDVAGRISMNFTALQDRVRRWLEASKGNVAEAKLEAKLEAKDARIVALEAALSALQSQVSALGGKPVEAPEEEDESAPEPRRPAKRGKAKRAAVRA